MAFDGGPGFLSHLGALGAVIAGFVRGFASITAKQLLAEMHRLRQTYLDTSVGTLASLKKLGSALWAALATIGAALRDGASAALKFIANNLQKLASWLKEKLGPIIRSLAKIKAFIDEFYRKWIRPIIDTIEFIRAINRILNIFHLDWLRKLDQTLARIEERIEDPFIWIRSRLTLIENWIDRIVTLDGLLQRITLLRSTWAHNAALIRQGLNGMTRPLPAFRKGRMLESPAVLETAEFTGAVRVGMIDGGGELGPAMREFVDQLRINARAA